MGAKTVVRFAGIRYLDRTAALESREVIAVGAEIELLPTATAEDAWELLKGDGADLAEVPLSRIFDPTFSETYSALPVFPNRSFMARWLVGYKKLDGAALADADLGLPKEDLTATTWMQDVLEAATRRQHKWTVAPVADLIAGLDSGKLAAALLPGGVDGLKPAVADADAVDRAAYESTNVFPILSVLVGRRDVFASKPWLPVALTDAFVEAKELGNKRHRYFGALSVGLPWLMSSIGDINENFAGDAWPYGLRPNLNALQRFSRRIGCDLSSEEIVAKFAPQTVPLHGVAETSFYVVPLSHL